MRKEDDIDNAIALACEHPDKAGVVSLGEVHMEHPSIVKKITDKSIIEPYVEAQKVTRRQQLDKAYFHMGLCI